ncbi:MAG: hypothetical protein ACRDQX_14790 [Pseudonocardiaceae bacterium]
MAVQTWVSMVLTSLLGEGIIVFVVGYARGHAAAARDYLARREVASWPSAGADPPPPPRPLESAPEVHVHLHQPPEGGVHPSPGASWPSWRDIPVLKGHPVIEGQVVRELPGGPAR